MGIAPATISQRLIANQGDDQTALSIDNSSDLQAGDLPKLRDPSVKSRFVNGAGPCVFYEYLNTQRIKDATVRKAIATAINRQAVITAMNGPLFGSIPQSFMSTSVRGFQPPDLGLKPTGDTAAAQALAAGKTFPKTLKYSVSAGRPVAEGRRCPDPERPEEDRDHGESRQHPDEVLLHDAAHRPRPV